MIAIVDYGAGNLSSVKKALDYLGAKSEISQDKEKILSASHIILPGVGSFGEAMESMKNRELTEIVKDAAKSGKPFLGICLGLQLLFKSSDESPEAEGLDLIPGKIVKIPKKEGLKVPHIGWNSVTFPCESKLFKGIPRNSYFYFVHSYYLTQAQQSVVSGITQYGVEIQCAVEQGNLCATQFHPEKSGEAGLQVLKNFLAMEG